MSFNTVIANNRLVAPIGSNLTNEATRTLMPSLGAIAYDSGANQLYYGDTTDWVLAQGQTGPTGASITGPTGPNPISSYGNMYWTLVNADPVPVASGTSVPWTSAGPTLGFTFNAGTGLTATQAGTYLVTWFYGCVAGVGSGQSSTNNPQSYTIGINGIATNASWTLQERQDTTTQGLQAMGGQACTTILSLAVGDHINLFNTLVGNVFHVNNANGAYCINGLGALAANLTLLRIGS